MSPRSLPAHLTVLLCLLAPLVTLATPRSVAAQDTDTVTVAIDGLVFAEPDDSSRVVLRVEAGERLKVVSERDDWIRVQLPRGTGWVLRAIVRRPDERPGLAGFGERRGKDARMVTVVAEYADIKAGPAEGYLSIKRVFQGETFEVDERSEDGRWLRVKVGGDLGWLRVDEVMRADAVFEGDRREGAGDEEAMMIAEEEEAMSAPSAHPRLRLRIGGMAQFASQSFDSNSTDQLLNVYETSTTLFGAEVGARYWIFDELGVSVDYAYGQGLPIVAQFDDAEAELKNSTQRIHAAVLGRWLFGTSAQAPWVGASLGALWHRFDIQETTISLFLPNTYTGLRLGVLGSVPLGPVRLWGDGGVVLLGSLSQGELSSGEQDAATWLGAELGGAFGLTEELEIYLKLNLDSHKTTFLGESTRRDDITEAVNRDRFISASAGVMWRPL